MLGHFNTAEAPSTAFVYAGALPTGTTTTLPPGDFAYIVTEEGEDEDADYFCLRIVGTNNAATSKAPGVSWFFSQAPAAVGQSWFLSCDVQVISGAVPSGGCKLRVVELDAQSVPLAGGAATSFTPTGTNGRFAGSATLSNAITALVTGQLEFGLIPPGGSIDLELKIRRQQLQKDFLTAWVPTGVAPASRDQTTFVYLGYGKGFFAAVSVALTILRVLAASYQAEAAAGAGLTRRLSKAIASARVTAANLRRNTSKRATAATTPAKVFRRSAARRLSVARTTVKTFRRAVDRRFQVSRQPLTSLIRGLVFQPVITAPVAYAGRALETVAKLAVAMVSGSLVRDLARDAFMATAGAVTSIRRATGKLILSAQTTVNRFVRSAQRGFTRTTVPAAEVVRSTPRAYQALAAGAASLRRMVGKVLEVAAIGAASLSRQIGKAVNGAQAAIADIIRSITHAEQVATSPAATVLRALTRTFSRAAGVVASVVRAPARTLATARTAAATIRREASRAVVATEAPAASVAKASPRAFSRAPTVIASLTRRTGKVIRASSATARSLVRQTGKALLSSSSPAARAARSVTRDLAAIAAAVALERHATQKVIQGLSEPAALEAAKIIGKGPRAYVRFYYRPTTNYLLNSAADNTSASVGTLK